jgi:predicted lipoprotein with Yx(FWY)xxD motif
MSDMGVRLLVRGAGCLAAVALLAACNNGGGSASGSGASSPKAAAKTTVAERSASGMGNVLVDSAGRTLYVADQEKGGMVACTDSCAAVWLPLTVDGSGTPSGPRDAAASLSTVMRTDGKAQVTFKGQPLYTFTLDRAAGDTKGDGAKDSFGGTSFSWHVAVASGAAGNDNPNPY